MDRRINGDELCTFTLFAQIYGLVIIGIAIRSRATIAERPRTREANTMKTRNVDMIYMLVFAILVHYGEIWTKIHTFFVYAVGDNRQSGINLYST